MNWVELVWPVVMALGMLLGLVHLLVWWAHRRQGAHLALAVAAFSFAALTMLERLALFNPSPDQIATLIRWMHVPLLFLVAALLYAVHDTFATGATWLAISALGLRILAVVLDFTTGVNLNFLSIDRVEWRSWGGVLIAHPVGSPNPGLWVAVLSNLMLAIFVLHTLVRGLRLQPQRRNALLLVCGAHVLLAGLLVATSLSWAVDMPRLPLTLPFVAVLLLVVGWQLGKDLMHWNQLEGQLRCSELGRLRVESELSRAALASGQGLWQWDVGAQSFIQNATNQRLLGNGETLGGDPSQTISQVEEDGIAALFAGVECKEIEQVRRRFDSAIQSADYEFEYQTRDRHGRRRWICLRGSVEHGPDGSPRIVRGLTQDISRRRSEQAQLHAVLDSSPTALLLVDPHGKIRYANRQAAVTFEYRDQDMIGVSVDELLPERCRGGHPHHRAEYAEHPRRRGMASGRELFARARGGREFPAEIALNPLDIEGTPHVVAAVEDLTERQQAAREVAIERESMAHMSRVSLIGEISGSLAHELNQPLAAILANAQAAQRMLRRNPAEIADVRDILEDIVENDRRAGQVISRLRGLLKKEFRAFVPLSANDLVNDAVRVIRNDLINRGVEYRLDLAANVVHIQGDPVQLQQVLLNLIINACEAMADRQPRTLTLRTTLAHEGHIGFEVHDTGSGIAPGMLETIFTAFQTSKPSGMGMGLSICRTIIGAHGGRIWACNLPGGGAALIFELPIVE
ncbi:MAG TPA: ATP-binding protein [Stenotrophomonas sp.]|nr:ATP-binding protein [Stenotrophomonas sp.]